MPNVNFSRLPSQDQYTANQVRATQETGAEESTNTSPTKGAPNTSPDQATKGLPDTAAGKSLKKMLSSTMLRAKASMQFKSSANAESKSAEQGAQSSRHLGEAVSVENSEEAGRVAIKTNQATSENTQPGGRAAGMPEPLVGEDQLQFDPSAAAGRASLLPAVVETRKLITELTKQLNDRTQPDTPLHFAGEAAESSDGTGRVEIMKNQAKPGNPLPGRSATGMYSSPEKATKALAELVLNQPLPDIPSESGEGHK
jgi:hypothetical protein